MRMNIPYAVLSAALLLGTTALPAQATSTSPGSSAAHAPKGAPAAADNVYPADKSKIEADYKDAKARCKPMAGNAKDVCTAQADGDEKVALAELEAARKDTSQSRYAVSVTKAKADYNVASEKCDDLSGKEKSACKKQAKADENKALGEAKAERAKVAKTDAGTAMENK